MDGILVRTVVADKGRTACFRGCASIESSAACARGMMRPLESYYTPVGSGRAVERRTFFLQARGKPFEDVTQ